MLIYLTVTWVIATSRVHGFHQELFSLFVHACLVVILDLAPLLIPHGRYSMPRTRRRKLPVTVSEKHGSSSTPRTSRGVIRKFHSLLKRQKTAEEDGDTLVTVNREMEKLGGLEMYQRMSCIGQSSDRGGGSQKILIGWLRQLGWAKVDREGDTEMGRKHR
jgi:25S rRNA (adenine(2142)-N(1))-methyltransferase, Bmt2